MADTADVVIIGGGIVGASVAYHLAEAGCSDVLIIEREAQQGLGSTGKATGGVRAQFATPVNIQMSRYSIDFLSRFEEATGYSSGYEPAGYLFVATNERQLEYLRTTRERQHAEGLTNVELLSADDISSLIPQMRADNVLGGSLCRTDGFVVPLNIMRGFAARAVERGARVWLDTRVVGIEVERGRVAGVLTTRGHVATRAVVNAAGAWAAGVARTASVEIPVVPVRRQIVGTEPLAGLPDKLPMVIDMSDGFHFRPAPRAEAGATPARFLLAWTDPEETPSSETELDSAFIPKIIERAARRVPLFARGRQT